MGGGTAVSEVLSDLAAGQWGMFTTAQARREGLSPQAVVRLANGGYLTRVRHGVYQIVGTPPSPSGELKAAWLAINPSLSHRERLAADALVVVSHRCAARLHELGDADADRFEFTADRRCQSRDRDLRFHRAGLERADWTVVDGLPVTTPLRTITDLAKARLDGGHLAGIVRDAVTTVHLDTDQVARGLRPFAHHYGHPLGDGNAFLTDLLNQAGIPQATVAATMLAVPSQDVLDALLARIKITPEQLGHLMTHARPPAVTADHAQGLLDQAGPRLAPQALARIAQQIAIPVDDPALLEHLFRAGTRSRPTPDGSTETGPVS
jgi:Transcriptional regulator, AbiEi antitoxin